MKQLTERGFEEVAERFRLLSDPGRLRILDLLRRRGELPVSEIAEEVERSLGHTSRQLAALCKAGLLGPEEDRDDGLPLDCRSWVFEVCETICGRLESEASRDDAPLFVLEGKG